MAYLAMAVNTHAVTEKIEDIPMAQDFPDVFPPELSGMSCPGVETATQARQQIRHPYGKLRIGEASNLQKIDIPHLYKY